MGQDIAQVSNFQVHRWVGAVEGQEYDLHSFTDASESAYACCLYICLKDSAQLIYSKGKVAPLRTNSLARLELQAAFLGAKCADFICQELRIKILMMLGRTASQCGIGCRRPLILGLHGWRIECLLSKTFQTA